jgi:hypothetical protein
MNVHSVKCAGAAVAGMAAVMPHVALGHPGNHDTDGTSMLHALTSPDHLLALVTMVIAMVLVAGVFARLFARKTRRRRKSEPVLKPARENVAP